MLIVILNSSSTKSFTFSDVRFAPSFSMCCFTQSFCSSFYLDFLPLPAFIAKNLTPPSNIFGILRNGTPQNQSKFKIWNLKNQLNFWPNILFDVLMKFGTNFGHLA
jgi:hypothetical protein